MARLTLSMPTELGPSGETRTGRSTADVDPRILRWLACWAGAPR